MKIHIGHVICIVPIIAFIFMIWFFHTPSNQVVYDVLTGDGIVYEEGAGYGPFGSYYD